MADEALPQAFDSNFEAKPVGQVLRFSQVRRFVHNPSSSEQQCECRRLYRDRPTITIDLSNSIATFLETPK
jgi:hypothetical protein